ncbi:MAG: hypothetical protein IJT18_05880 [Oscillospiraceae bacterium]|nr:hypothetical protein [Oscillospiraceae bacterium]
MTYRKIMAAYILKESAQNKPEKTASYSELFELQAQLQLQHAFAQSSEQLYLALKEQSVPVRQIITERVDRLWNACRKPYAALCVCAILTGATGFAFAKKKAAVGELPNKLAELLAECAAWFYTQKETFLSRVLAVITDADDLSSKQLKQFLDNNTDVSYWITFLDDPRDTIRVLQGIQIYNSRH